MAEIVNINLKNIDGKWSFGVVRDDDYTEVVEDNIEEIQEHLDALIKFAQGVKSEKLKKLEKKEEENKKMLKILIEKTTLDERIDMVSILPRWEVDTEYKAGDERTYNDILYVAKKDHKSSYEAIPGNSFEYWKKALKQTEIPEIYNHEKKYKINEKCTFNRRIYSSLIEQEGQSPFASPKTWEDEGEV